MLGSPTYALSVVLFTLLIGTGLGSFASARVLASKRFAHRAALGWLLGVLAVVGLSLPVLVTALAGAATSVRIGGAASLLLAMGFFLGLPFPLGMKTAEQRSPELMPWLWGLNGAASVLCSVGAAAVALSAGIGATYWCGVACYVVALLSLPGVAHAERTETAGRIAAAD